MMGPKYSGKNITHLVSSYLGEGKFSEYELQDSPFSTPWGRAEKVILFHRGVRYIITDRETGFMISKRFGEKNISDTTLLLGQVYGGYYCFVDKQAVQAVFSELKALDPALDTPFTQNAVATTTKKVTAN